MLFDISIRQVCCVLGVQLQTVKGWTCHGASAAHATTRLLASSLVARNLQISATQGLATTPPRPALLVLREPAWRSRTRLLSCHCNPDLRQREITSRYGNNLRPPVVCLTQLMGRPLDWRPGNWGWRDTLSIHGRCLRRTGWPEQRSTRDDANRRFRPPLWD